MTSPLDWSQCPAVESVPGKVSGRMGLSRYAPACCNHHRNLEDLTVEEVMEQFDVTREQIAAVLDFVARSLNVSLPEQPPPSLSMLILFDHGTPKGLIHAFSGHTIFTAQSRGWERLNNGALLNAAEEAALDFLLTTDRRIRYQHNLTGRKIAIVVLTGSTKWSHVRLHLKRIAAAVNAATPGSYDEVEIQFK